MTMFSRKLCLVNVNQNWFSISKVNENCNLLRIASAEFGMRFCIGELHNLPMLQSHRYWLVYLNMKRFELKNMKYFKISRIAIMPKIADLCTNSSKNSNRSRTGCYQIEQRLHSVWSLALKRNSSLSYDYWVFSSDREDQKLENELETHR